MTASEAPSRWIARAWVVGGGRTGPRAPGRPDTGTWDGAPGSKPAPRRGPGGNDEGGPGDSPASVAWLRAGRGTGYGTTSHGTESRHGTERWAPYREIQQRIDPETGVLIADDRRWDPRQNRSIDRHESSEGPALPIGGPSALDRPIDRRADAEDDRGGPGDETAAARRWAREQVEARADRSNSVARLEPELRPVASVLGGFRRGALRLGALAGAVRPHRRLPAPPLDPQRRDADHRGPAHRHRPHRARDDEGPRRRPVRQARRRDHEADQARPARARDAGRDRRVHPAHRARLRGLPRPRPDPRGDPRGVRDAPGRGHRRRVPGRVARPDADAAQVAAGEPRRPGGGGRDHPPGADPGQRGPPVPAPQAGAGAGDLPAPQPRADPPRHARRDPVPGAGDEDRDRRRGVHAGGLGRVPAGDGHVPQRARDGEAPRASSSTGAPPSTGSRPTTPRSCSGGARRSPRSASPRAMPPPSPGPPTSRASSSCSTRPSSRSG